VRRFLTDRRLPACFCELKTALRQR